jgi:hypothetical protein
MKRLITLSAAIAITAAAGFAQVATTHPDGAFVDPHGVLRWKDSNDEVRLFGVNYTTPFAYSYRAHKRLGLSLKKAIDLDVAHMVRLDLNAYRVHVWDREVSDSSGNLLNNEHLDLLDYLLSRLAEHGIKSILTPIAWWGNGWPEPDEMTGGFSQRYSKQELVTKPKAREAQRRYLRQFVEHTNPYTKISCVNDPAIIALEIINEPNHPDDERATTEYVNEMAAVIRDAGFTKPIFYNISENWSDRQANAVTRANVDGVSFQWYPTDLVHGKALVGNFLFNVNRYFIPSAGVAGFDRKGKIVYEFDAADVASSYMYPAMARSFREAGMQFAAMFSYDPVQIAWSNTEYPTHFVNLLYTPSKAISLMIAANAFRQLPRGKSFGAYPENVRFQDFRVSSEEDLSEWNSTAAFVYSGSTQSLPKNARTLTRVAGVGNSPVVQYDGTGAYFLDKLGDGIWRLEVNPDVVWLRDPFGPTSMSRPVARLFWRERRIHFALPDLGDSTALVSFSGRGLQVPGRHRIEHEVRPGVYLVTATTAAQEEVAKQLPGPEGFLEGLYTPPAAAGIDVMDRSRPYSLESGGSAFSFEIAADDSISGATLFIRRPGWRRFAGHALKNVGGYRYVPVDTNLVLQPGRVEYCVTVDAAGTTTTFPGEMKATPLAWDFAPGTLWTMKVLKAGEPVVVFDAWRDRKELVFTHFSPSLRYEPDYRNGPTGEEASLWLKVKLSGTARIPFGFQMNVRELFKPLVPTFNHYHTVVVTARSPHDTLSKIGIRFVLGDGRSYEAKVAISRDWREYRIPVSHFRPGTTLMLPDHYPRFLEQLYFPQHVWNVLRAEAPEPLDFRLVDRVQITVDPVDTQQHDGQMTFEISSIRLDP